MRSASAGEESAGAIFAAEATRHLARALRQRPAPGPSIILAVSGGPDSLALLRAAADVPALSSRCHVVTVDHGLRAESVAEARFVADVAARFGLPHSTWRWTGKKPAGNRQGRARHARYALLVEAARDLGATAIITAHHQDDQIETHLLARARKAGDRGLAGMRPAREIAPGIRLLRPFLDIPGKNLKAAAADLLPIDDPSNGDARFDRVRLRQAIAAGAVDREAILRDIALHAVRRDTGDARLGGALSELFAARHLVVSAGGQAEMATLAFEALDETLAVELLGRILPAVGGSDYPPLRAAMVRLRQNLLAPSTARRSAHSLGGVVSERAHAIVFTREYGRQGPFPVSVAAGDHHAVFDGRFDVAWNDGAPGGASALLPLGHFGRGNARQRTLPVLVDAAGLPLGAVVDALPKFAEPVAVLPVRERVTWRLLADLQM